MNWANRLTILRILLVPVFVMAVLYHRMNIAFVVFILAAFTDALDGYIARHFDQKTRLGTIMDPIADKLLLGSAFICFSLVHGLPAHIKMPIYVPLIVISRDVIILLGAAMMQMITGHVKVRPTVLGKITTFLQMLTILALLLNFTHSSWIWNLTVVMTLVSGADYLRIAARELNGKL